MAVTLSGFSYAMQTFYLPQIIMETVARDHPFLGMLMARRKRRVTGDYVSFPIGYSNGGGRSATFSYAQGNPNGSKGVKLALTTAEDYAVIQWSDEVLESSEGMDAAAFFDARKKEMDVKFEELGNSASVSLFRSGSGSIGQIISTQGASSTTLTMKNAEDVKNLQVGMKIVGDSVDGGGTVGTTVTFVKSVDLVNGTFEAAATDGGVAVTATAADLTASQYVFPYGDYDEKIKGVAAWIPATVASNDSFFGINRSVDRVRLAGWYLDKTGVPVEEAIVAAAKEVTKISRANPKYAFINPTDWLTLTLSLSSKVMYVDVKPNAQVAFGYRGVMINGPKGPIEVLMDSDVPDGECHLVDLESWELLYKGSEPLHLQNRDGLVIRAVSDADAWEARMKYNMQLACGAPGFNARIKLR
jgi:hypothetical protein